MQRSLLRRRNFAAEAEILCAVEDFDVRLELDTDAEQHLRRRSDEKQERMHQILVFILSEAKGPYPSENV